MEGSELLSVFVPVFSYLVTIILPLCQCGDIYFDVFLCIFLRVKALGYIELLKKKKKKKK